MNTNNATGDTPTKPDAKAPVETTEQRLTNEVEQLKTKMARAVAAIRNNQPDLAIDILS